MFHPTTYVDISAFLIFVGQPPTSQPTLLRQRPPLLRHRAHATTAPKHVRY
jgi:hypothetical protein